MSQAKHAITRSSAPEATENPPRRMVLFPLPEHIQNPLDRAVWLAAEKLAKYHMTTLWSAACPEVDEAEALVNDLFGLTRIIDEMLLSIGQEAKAHFGGAVEIELFREQLRGALEGNATYTIAAAAEAADEWRRDLNDEYRADVWRDRADEAA
jgi:hypothetical protein